MSDDVTALPEGCRCNAWSEGECGCGLYGTGRRVDHSAYAVVEVTEGKTT